MGLPSLSSIFTALFIGFVGYSVYNISRMFQFTTCDELQVKKGECISAYLQSEPELEMILLTSLTPVIKGLKSLELLARWNDFDYMNPWERTASLPLPAKTCRNGSLYLNIFVVPLSNASWPHAIASDDVVQLFMPLTAYKVPNPESFNLLETIEKKKPEAKNSKPKTHLRSHVFIRLMTEKLMLHRKSIPLDIQMMTKKSRNGKYLPMIIDDHLLSRGHHHIEVTPDICKTSNVTVHYEPITLGKLRLSYQFGLSLASMKSLGFSDKDLDEVKGIFADTNIYLLVTTIVVSSIHLLLDILAFKNDVIFWKNKKNRIGVSTRTVIWRAFSQIVVFLYLMDEKSSLLVLIPSLIGAFIEVWKIFKAFKISVAFSGIMPRFTFGQVSRAEKQTEQFDSQSMKYLTYVLYPLCSLGALYSLLYISHRSWYSWVIQSIANGVYAFGFIFMLPQLFINYKLKSVAHLPWRAFMYKAFNTFIDDLFAFIIVVPTAHRIACFRDDIVFIIYLYQRWLYPVDKARIEVLDEDGGTTEIKAKSE